MKLNIPCLYKRHNHLMPAKEIFDFDTTMPHAISCTRLPDDTIVCNPLVDETDMQKSLTKTTITDFVQKCTVLGDEKELALLFLDIRNFTSFMEQRAPYDVIYVIRKLFVLFNDSIREAGGRIIETMGAITFTVRAMPLLTQQVNTRWAVLLLSFIPNATPTGCPIPVGWI